MMEQKIFIEQYDHGITLIFKSMRKVFRIIKNELSEEGVKAFHPLWYRIEQRYTVLFFIHWWGTPVFEPPHNFENDCKAIKHIKEHYPNAIIYDYYSENKCKNK